MRAVLIVAMTLVVTIGLASPAAAIAVDERVVQEIYVINGPEWFDDQGLLTRNLREEGALERYGIKPGSSRPVDLTRSDEEAHQRALRDQAEYGTPSEKFAAESEPEQTDDITVEECRERSDLSARPQGWIKNHFSYCQLSYVLAVELRCNWIFCTTIGLFEARVTLLGVAYNGLRNVEFIPTLDQIFIFGSASGSLFTYEVECAGSPDTDSCLPAESEVTKLVPLWDLYPEATLFFHSPALPSSPSVGEQKDFGTFQVELKYRFPTGVTREASGPETSVRFDSAWYLGQGRTQGSIFNRVDPWLSFSVTDEQVKYSAWNIYTAQYHPTSTEPFLADKSLPGASANNPLHRLYHDKVRRKANRTEATGYCKQRWPGYGQLGQDCDEYPFACTYEGAAAYKYPDYTAPEYSYAVRPIPSYDNQESGRRLGRWYSNDRIIHEDPFYVKIVGVNGGAPEPPPGPPSAPDDGIDCGDGLT